MTIALPMSCTSPCTVPITTVPLAWPAAPASRASLRDLVAASMAWAESMSSGRNISPLSNISPTSLMPAMKPFFMISAGAIPAARASFATWAALSASALTIESIASRTISSFVILRLLLDVDLVAPRQRGRGGRTRRDVSPAVIHPPVDQAGSAAGKISPSIPKGSRQERPRSGGPATRPVVQCSGPCATSAPSSVPPAKHPASSCRSPTAAPTRPATSAARISTSRSASGPSPRSPKTCAGCRRRSRRGRGASFSPTATPSRSRRAACTRSSSSCTRSCRSSSA